MSIRTSAKLLQAAGRRSRRAFTLLEVMLTVMIITFLVMTVYRFLTANLNAIRSSTEVTTEREELNGLVSYLQEILEDLPQKQQGVLLGNPNKFHDLASDELQWVCRAGHGLMTMSANDEYRVTMAIQPVEKSSSQLEIGLRRQLSTSESKDYKWLPLIRPAAALEFRYFEPRLNQWIDRWADTNIRPSLVRVRIWKTADSAPLEAILPVPSSTTQPQLNVAAPPTGAGTVPGLGSPTGAVPGAPAPPVNPQRR